MYYFKHKDNLLAELSAIGNIFHIERVYKNAFVLPMLRNDISFNTWIQGRQALFSRPYVTELFKTAGIRTILDFVNCTYCLSLSDCLWLCSDNDICWCDVSLFQNSFSKLFTDIAMCRHGFSGRVVRAMSPELSLGGNSMKFCRRSNGKILFYKSFGGMAELQYSGCYAEYFAGQLSAYLGVDNYVKYDLCMINNILWSVSGCYTSEDESEIAVGLLYDDAIHLDTHILKYRGVLNRQFRDMLILDCLLFNVDRHDGNIALMYDNDFNIVGLVPVYDFDHALFYDLPLIGRSWDYVMEGVQRYVPITYNDHTFKEQFNMCIYKEMYDKLLNCFKEFEFVNHVKYPLCEGRLKGINSLFKWNLGRLLNIS